MEAAPHNRKKKKKERGNTKCNVTHTSKRGGLMYRFCVCFFCFFLFPQLQVLFSPFVQTVNSFLVLNNLFITFEDRCTHTHTTQKKDVSFDNKKKSHGEQADL